MLSEHTAQDKGQQFIQVQDSVQRAVEGPGNAAVQPAGKAVAQLGPANPESPKAGDASGTDGGGRTAPVFSFMGKLGDVVLLNLTWLLCCLPVLTIGASTSFRQGP